MDKEGEKFIKENMETEDISFIDRYYYAISSCGMFPSKFQYLLNDPCGKVKPIQEIKAYLGNQKHGKFSVVHDEIKRMLTEFIDKVHHAGKSENAPNDIYLETFNDFKTNFSDEFLIGFENFKWNPDSIKEISYDGFDELLIEILKQKAFLTNISFPVSYPKIEKQESNKMK